MTSHETNEAGDVRGSLRVAPSTEGSPISEQIAENKAPCQSCGVDNPTCFLEGGYCCISCQESGGMVHWALITQPADECDCEACEAVRDDEDAEPAAEYRQARGVAR